MPPRITPSIRLKGSTLLPLQQASNPLIIPIQTHVLASALVYCIKTTRFKLLCATVVEPLSSAWPVIATVTRWNPLACVGVDWAMYVIPTLLCLLCLELCQVWFIWVMGQSEMLMPVMWGMCWTCFGKGIDERPCRSTWWVVSLRPSLRTEICMCDLKIQLLPCIGILNWPSRLLNHPSTLSRSCK